LSSPAGSSKSAKPFKPESAAKESPVSKADEGVKPTMETRGPPMSTPSSYGFMHPSLMPRPGFPPGLPYDALSSALMGLGGPYGAHPFLAAQQLAAARPPFGPAPPQATADLLRAQFLAPTAVSGPEDLSRGGGVKALDILQQAASQYFNNHKIHELQERAIKSPDRKASPRPSQSPTPGRKPPTPSGATTSVASASPPVMMERTSASPLSSVRPGQLPFGLSYPMLPPGGVPGLVPPAAHSPFNASAFPSKCPKSTKSEQKCVLNSKALAVWQLKMQIKSILVRAV
jgi:hypothetical protein